MHSPWSRDFSFPSTSRDTSFSFPSANRDHFLFISVHKQRPLPYHFCPQAETTSLSFPSTSRDHFLIISVHKQRPLPYHFLPLSFSPRAFFRFPHGVLSLSQKTFFSSFLLTPSSITYPFLFISAHSHLTIHHVFPFIFGALPPLSESPYFSPLCTFPTL